MTIGTPVKGTWTTFTNANEITSLSGTQNIAAGDTVGVFVGYASNYGVPNAVTVGGVSMGSPVDTHFFTTGVNQVNVAYYELSTTNGAPTGTGVTIQVSCSAGTYMFAQSFAVQGITGRAAISKTGGLSTSVSQSVTGVTSGQLVAQSFVNRGWNGSQANNGLTTFSGGTFQAVGAHRLNVSSVISETSLSTATADTTFSCTTSPSTYWVGIAVVYDGIIPSGSAAASARKATAAFGGTQAHTGTMSTTVRKSSTSLSGAETQFGGFAGTLHIATPAFSGQSQSIATATISAAVRKLAAGVAGVFSIPGSLASTAQKTSTSATGRQAILGTLSSITTKPAASIVGGMLIEIFGSAASVFKPLTTAIQAAWSVFDRQYGTITQADSDTAAAVITDESPGAIINVTEMP